MAPPTRARTAKPFLSRCVSPPQVQPLPSSCSSVRPVNDNHLPFSYRSPGAVKRRVDTRPQPALSWPGRGTAWAAEAGSDYRMKYLPLVWSGIWRKRGRTILIFLQVAVAFSLFGVLQGLKTGVDHAIAAARADLLIVHSRLSWAVPLPLGLLGQIGSVPGVTEVIPVDLSLGTYQNARQQVGIVAVRPDKGWLSAFTYTISPAYV